MAQKKNCDKRRQKNLPKLPSQIPAVSRPTIEDVIDSESDDDFVPVDSVASPDDDSKFNMESGDEDNILREIQTDSEFLAFVSRLQEAHDQMQWQQRKERLHIWEIQRDGRQKRKGQAGFPSITKYFQKQSDKEVSK